MLKKKCFCGFIIVQLNSEKCNSQTRAELVLSEKGDGVSLRVWLKGSNPCPNKPLCSGGSDFSHFLILRRRGTQLRTGSGGRVTYHKTLLGDRGSVEPNGRTQSCQCLCSVLKAVFSLASSIRATCQYPLVKSSVEMKRALPSRSMRSSACGSG